MSTRCIKLLTAFAIIAPTFVGSVAASEPMRYIYHSPESKLDKRYLYQWKILATALEKTQAQYGAYELTPSEFMTEQRQAFELINATGKLTVMYLSTTPEFERQLIPVRIPVDRNLGGYCVFLIRKEQQKRFTPLRTNGTLDDLRKFSFGLGLGWIDVDILKHNHFRVVTGSSYEGLFEMTENGRFDVFLRGAVEVIDELAERHSALPSLAIEDGLVLYYPLPMYFWFAKTDAGRQLATRAELGMRTMIADGTYDRLFEEFQGPKIRRLQLAQRRIFRIDNPNVGPETPLADKHLWFDPKTYRPPR